MSAFWPPERKDAHLRGLTCYCSGHCPPDHSGGEAPETGTCIARLGAKCFTAVREVVVDEATGETAPEYTYGCQPPDDEGGILQCKGHLVPHLEPASIACCSDGDLCNRDLRPMYTVVSNEEVENAGSGAGGGGLTMLGAGIDQATAIALVLSLTVCFGERGECGRKMCTYILPCTVP